ncbi:hypothetical protein [Streptomyces sp. NPDC059262]|uniref:hypothetical protein n=1 Tax=Streptomyces sp. NPDC059262 TaxID=3346797 RepID=UPI0036C5E7DE
MPTACASSQSGDREDNGGADCDNIQQGDQNARDHGRSDASREHERSARAPENGHEDGPGGHADSSDTADHQFVGNE